ncbi:hypothetical protein BT69DRAFT_1279511 [Atractiella rhizophila]|nr:hypothetical protein BT69DRAFT_1279511 [Atractiella rhizophila]
MKRTHPDTNAKPSVASATGKSKDSILLNPSPRSRSDAEAHSRKVEKLKQSLAPSTSSLRVCGAGAGMSVVGQDLMVEVVDKNTKKKK